jgi:4-alpha-glucanotransferase
MVKQAQKVPARAGGIEGRALLGAAVPVGALRGEDGIGVGEFLDLIEFGKLCARMGVGLIQILPVNDTGYQSSPYFALTAFALNPLYLRISALKNARLFGMKLKDMARKFSGMKRFSYEEMLRAKITLLKGIFAVHKEEIAADPELKKWIAANPWVKEYAVFRHLKELNDEKSWKEWPKYRKVSARDIEALWNDKSFKGAPLFWAWVQEALDKQFSAAAKALSDMGISLKGDLPIMMNEDSHDVWAHPEFFDQNLSAGAPPDMYSPGGQNWGFPLYDWKALEKKNYSWWRERLKTAAKYYQAFRIDHVLGFFRVWGTSREDISAALGRFVPYEPIKKKELIDAGFDEARILWMSRPHIPTGELWADVREHWEGHFLEDDVVEVDGIFQTALDRIGKEELWLFKKTVKGEKDIAAMKLRAIAKKYLMWAWENRLFLEYEKGCFSPVWKYKDSRAYESLSGEERRRVDALVERHRQASEKIWEEQGKKLLSVLAASSPMLPCAEDLGAVPECVPRVLAGLNILGLRVARWNRDWGKEGQPYIPFDAYPELSVCTTSVHDSSTLREWWDKEADQRQFAGFLGLPSLPAVYNPGTARAILLKAAGAVSRLRVFQIQDLLHLSNKWYDPDPASERVNVPGTVNEFNWTYRLPAEIAEIAKDKELIAAVSELAAVVAAAKPAAGAANSAAQAGKPAVAAKKPTAPAKKSAAAAKKPAAAKK